MAQIQSGASADLLTVDATSKAARGTLYDVNGNVISKQDKAASGIVPGTTQGFPNIVADYKTPRLMRGFTDGSLVATGPLLQMADMVEGAAVNTRLWIQTITTMTIVQAAGAVTFNAGASAATTVGAMHTSHRFFWPIPRARLIFRARQRHTAHFANNLIELGFGTPATATAAPIGNGAIWRKDGTGQYIPVLAFNGAETLGTPISNATWVASIAAADQGVFEVEVTTDQAIFRAYTAFGVLVNEQILDVPTTVAGFTATRLQALIRTYNSAATGTAVQVIGSYTVVELLDLDRAKPWDHVMAGMDLGSVVNPVTFAQLANSVNGVTPTNRTLSNTAAGETTLGGALVATAMAAAVTDLIMFGWQNPSPYQFMFTGIKISRPLNQVAAVTTTETLFEYGMAFNASAVSLATGAPYPPMRMMLPGFHNALVALAANKEFTLGSDIVWQPNSPIAVFPGRFLHVFLRCLVGTATATETYRWNCVISGYFE